MIVGRPAQRPINLISTKVLCDRHANLDCAIARINGYSLASDFPLEDAGPLKIGVKREIEHRRLMGDAIAEAYAQQRGWSSLEVVVTEAAE